MKRLFLLISTIFLTTGLFAQGYEIEVKINNLQDSSIILAHHMNKSIFPDDTITLDKNGTGVFKGDSALPGGMYLIFLPNKKYFDILIDDDQHFTIVSDTNNFLDNTSFKGSEQNTVFYDYQKFIRDKRQEKDKLRKEKEALTSKRKKEKIDEQINAIDEQVKDYLANIINTYPGKLIGSFLKAMQEIKIPDPPKDEEGNIDSTFRYRYYRRHYFDNFDVSDARLLRTPIYKNKIMQYINYVVPQIPDTLIKETDYLIEQSRTTDELFRFMLITLFNHFAKSKIMGMDAVYIHIADKYYIPEATWSTDDFIEKLKERVEAQKPTLLGNKAPNIEMIQIPKKHFLQAKNDTAAKHNVYVGSRINLHDIKADYYILYFWEYDCGHCKKATPKLYKIYDTLKDDNVAVIAFHMLFGKEGKANWINFVNKHELYDWINVWNPYSYAFKQQYDIRSSPVVFVLDKNHEIIGKRIGVEQAAEIIHSHIKHNQNKKND